MLRKKCIFIHVHVNTIMSLHIYKEKIQLLVCKLRFLVSLTVFLSLGLISLKVNSKDVGGMNLERFSQCYMLKLKLEWKQHVQYGVLK